MGWSGWSAVFLAVGAVAAGSATDGTVPAPATADHVSVTVLRWAVAPFAGDVFSNAAGDDVAATVNAHHVPPSASIVPLALCARTCQ